MPLSLSLVFRDWDFLTPLLLGEVADDRLELRIERVDAMPDNPSETEGLDGAEVSLSRFVQQRVAGWDRDVGIATFPMRAFRHRCIITRGDHPARHLGDLRGGRIGVTGWQDSGNTWTRDALLDAGVLLEEVRWFAGRLTAQHPVIDRLGRFAQPGWIDAIPGERPMLDMLREGALDAVFTPFMPEGFFAPESEFRPVLDDLPNAERRYFEARGFVPGIHAVALRADLARRESWLPGAVSDLLDRSRALWTAKRRRYADTSPWLFDELLCVGRWLPEDHDASGLEANRPMIEAFVAAAHAQGLIPAPIAAEDIFIATDPVPTIEQQEDVSA